MTAAAQTLVQPTLETLLGSRNKTDTYIPRVWLVVPIADYVVWASIPTTIYLAVSLSLARLSQLVIPLAFLGTLGFLVSAGSAYVVYMLVNRRNTHFAREQALLARALESVKAKTSPEDMKTQLPLSSAEQGFGHLVQSSGERSAVLWALLTLLPYVGWLFLVYVLAFLSEDWKKHEVREDLVIQDLERTLKVTGSGGPPPRTGYSGFVFRNTIGLILASIVTLGVLELYWLYLAMRDPLPHFEYHQHFEDALSKMFPDNLVVPGGPY